MQLLPVDYSMHDRVYRDLFARGARGWSGDDEYAAMFKLAAPALPPIAAGRSPRVLELGSGAGNLSILLAKQGYTLTGVDVAPTAVAWARERALEANTLAAFQVDSVVTLSSCKDASFDAVIDAHCLHCIIGEDRARCLAAVRRVLTPGGVFVVLTMCGAISNERLQPLFDPLTNLIVVDGRPTRYVGQAHAIVAEVARAGFQINHVHVDARRSAADQDDLVIHARRPSVRMAHGN